MGWGTEIWGSGAQVGPGVALALRDASGSGGVVVGGVAGSCDVGWVGGIWLAELGGYTGKSSGGPPGTITISRGLAKLRAGADAIAAFLAADDEENG